MQRCWVNFQCRGVLLTWITVGQGHIVLAVGAGGGGLDIFSPIYHFSFLSPSLWETARYRLKYCLKGLLSPNQSIVLTGALGAFIITNVQVTLNQRNFVHYCFSIMCLLGWFQSGPIVIEIQSTLDISKSKFTPVLVC